jgi:hypothetical protein
MAAELRLQKSYTDDSKACKPPAIGGARLIDVVQHSVVLNGFASSEARGRAVCAFRKMTLGWRKGVRHGFSLSRSCHHDTVSLPATLLIASPKSLLYV